MIRKKCRRIGKQEKRIKNDKDRMQMKREKTKR